MKPLRYLRLFWVQLRASLLLAVQYRYDFLVEGLVSLLFTAIALVPLLVIYDDRTHIAGWSFGEALLVIGWFTLLSGLLEGAINPSLSAVVEHIRKGTLDFVLLKPADAQFLVSTARFLPWRFVSVISAGAIFGYAFHQLGRVPSVTALAAAALLFLAALVILYGLWILIVSSAFYVVKVDNLTYLLASVFDAARWPVSVFRGVFRLVFTFVIPLGLMTTYPAEALLGRLPPSGMLVSLGVAVVLGVGSRLVWLRAIRSYTSAGS